MQLYQVTVPAQRSSSLVMMNVGLALGGRYRTVGVLLQLADSETFVEHVEGHLTLARLLVDPD